MQMKPDLVVIGTHGRSGFQRLILGSVTEKVLRRAPCPVLSVPPRAAESASPVVYKRILCPAYVSRYPARANESSSTWMTCSDAPGRVGQSNRVCEGMLRIGAEVHRDEDRLDWLHDRPPRDAYPQVPTGLQTSKGQSPIQGGRGVSRKGAPEGSAGFVREPQSAVSWMRVSSTVKRKMQRRKS